MTYMKTIYRVLRNLGLVLLPLWLVSCEDLLTEDPKGQLAVVNFFNTKGDLDQSLNAMYSILANEMYANNAVGFDAVSGDDITTHPASNKQSIREVDSYNISNNNSWADELWNRRWKVVKAANFIINNAERTPTTKEEINKALGQAYYWRAYSYFYFVMTWGKVPMVVKDEIDYNMPLATIPEIYDLIVSDLQKAEAMVPINYTEEPYARNGVNIAVSQAAVKATLSYVYMAMAGWPLNKGTAYYKLAADKAKEVIDGVKNSTYNNSLLPEYKDVYSLKWNSSNPEVLLGIYYSRTGTITNATLCDFLADMAYGGGWGDTNGEIKFWKDFPDGPRKESTYFSKIILMSDANDDNPVLRDWWYDDPNTPRTVVAPCFMKKVERAGEDYFDVSDPSPINQNGEKMHQVIRLSEVYCWYAEAVGRSGEGDKTLAVSVLNEVRNRADGTASNRYSTSMSYEELAESAYNEHGWEIAGYYWANIATRARDMFRMNRIKDHFEFRKENPEIEVASGVFRKEAIPVTGVWSDSKMYFPYPANDVALNPNLKN